MSPRRAWLTGNTASTADFICRRLFIPNDFDLIIAVNGALTLLTESANWEQFGSATPDETAALMFEMYQEYLESDACLIGAIFPYATIDPPPSTLPCDGSEYDRVDYPRLYDLLDPSLIVDADTFKTPDLRNQFIFGTGDFDPFDTGGEAEHQLTVGELAEHSHTDSGHAHTEGTTTPTGAGEIPGAAAAGVPGITGSASANIQPTGGNEPHNNMPPFTALPRCIVAR